jgi:hypothetical protein
MAAALSRGARPTRMTAATARVRHARGSGGRAIEVMSVTGWQRADQDGVERTRTIRRNLNDVVNAQRSGCQPGRSCFRWQVEWHGPGCDFQS